MKTDTRLYLLEQLREELRRSEEGAGISESTAPGWCDVADGDEYARQVIRDAYFSVPDKILRKQLIRKACELERELRNGAEADVQAARQDVRKAAAYLGREPWSWAALLSVGSVVTGYGMFGMPGAIAGAVGGYFLGRLYPLESDRF